MAIEPVNERPIFPSATRWDSIGLGNWTVSMIRQLTTVFQQYGYRLNNALLREDLDTNGGEVVTDGGDSVLRESDLAENSGTIPETDRSNTFTAVQKTDGAGFEASNGQGVWFDANVTDDSDSSVFRARDSGGSVIADLGTRLLDGVGGGYLNLQGDWRLLGHPFVDWGSNANGLWVRFAPGPGQTQGIQACFKTRLTLPFSDSAGCEATWTFPAQFATTTNLTVIPSATGVGDGTNPVSYAGNATPSSGQIGEYSHGNLATSSVGVRVQRQQGETNFQPGDEMYSTLFAIGRWEP